MGGIREIIGIEARAWERRGVLKCTFIHPLFYSPYLYSVLVLLFSLYILRLFSFVSIDYAKSLLSA